MNAWRRRKMSFFTNKCNLSWYKDATVELAAVLSLFDYSPILNLYQHDDCYLRPECYCDRPHQLYPAGRNFTCFSNSRLCLRTSQHQKKFQHCLFDLSPILNCYCSTELESSVWAQRYKEQQILNPNRIRMVLSSNPTVMHGHVIPLKIHKTDWGFRMLLHILESRWSLSHWKFRDV